MVRRRESRNLCWSVGRGDLCCVKRRRDSRGGTDIAVAVFPAVSAVCAGCPFGAFQNGYLRRSPRSTLDNRAWLGWRSEERRVGKECRCRCALYYSKKEESSAEADVA